MAYYFVLLAGIISILTCWDTHRVVHLGRAMERALWIHPAEQTDVAITARAYTLEASQQNLGCDLLERGYRPIQLTVANHSQHTLGLSSQGIVGVELASVNELASSVMSSALPRAIAYKIGGFLFWPLFLPSTIDTIITFHAREELKLDYYTKGVKNLQELLPPYAQMDRILFVKGESLPTAVEVSLFDFDLGRDLIFQVPISEEIS